MKFVWLMFMNTTVRLKGSGAPCLQSCFSQIILRSRRAFYEHLCLAIFHNTISQRVIIDLQIRKQSVVALREYLASYVVEVVGTDTGNRTGIN